LTDTPALLLAAFHEFLVSAADLPDDEELPPRSLLPPFPPLFPFPPPLPPFPPPLPLPPLACAAMDSGPVFPICNGSRLIDRPEIAAMSKVLVPGIWNFPSG
jgi:hypothetical protein